MSFPWRRRQGTVPEEPRSVLSGPPPQSPPSLSLSHPPPPPTWCPAYLLPVSPTTIFSFSSVIYDGHRRREM